jgi:hypothetical protein
MNWPLFLWGFLVFNYRRKIRIDVILGNQLLLNGTGILEAKAAKFVYRVKTDFNGDGYTALLSVGTVLRYANTRSYYQLDK